MSIVSNSSNGKDMGVPLLLGYVLQSWQWGLESLILLLLSFPPLLSKTLRNRLSVPNNRVRTLFFVVVCLATGVAGWIAGKTLLTLWHLTTSPPFLHILVQGGCAVLFGGGLLLIWGFLVVMFDNIAGFPRYTILPTFTFTCDLTMLSLFIGLAAHQWWVCAITLIILWSFIQYPLTWWGKAVPRYRWLVAFLLSGPWAYSGWIVGEWSASSFNLAVPTLVFALVGLGTGFLCHFIGYVQFGAIGTEGNLILSLEDLWIDSRIAALLYATAQSPIKTWESFYFWLGLGYSRQGKYTEAIACYARASNAHQAFHYSSLGDAYTNQGDFTQALENFQRAIELDSDHAPAYSGQGFIYASQGYYARALALYDLALARDPQDAAIYRRRGDVYARQGDFAHALADLNRAIELGPGNSLFLGERGRIYAQQQDYEHALEDFNRAIALNPREIFAYDRRSSLYFARQQYVEARSDRSRVIWLEPDNALNYLLRGQISQRLEEYPSALADFNQALALDASDALIYISRGQVYYWQNEPALALADFNQALTLEPENSQAFFQRGLIYAELQEYTQAIADYTQSIQFNSAYAPAYYRRGNAYQDQGQHDLALPDYSQALHLDPHNVEVLSARSYLHFQQKNYALALTDLEQIILLDPHNGNAYHARGQIYHEFADYTRAYTEFSQALTLKPEDVLIYYNRGATCHQQARYSEALADYTQAIALAPDNPTLYQARAWTYQALQNIHEALTDYNRAIAYDPENAGLLLERGNLYATNEEFARALIDYTQALTLDPQNVQAYNGRGNLWRSHGDYLRALDDYNQAISLDSRNATFYSNRGYTYFYLDQYMRALTDFDQSLALDPTLSFTYYRRGNLYYYQGEYACAVVDLNQALSLDPTDRAAMYRRGNVYAAQHEYERAIVEYESALLLPITAKEYVADQDKQIMGLPGSLPTADRDAAISEPETSFLDGQAILAQLRKGKVPISWQVYRHKAAFTYIIVTGLLLGLCVAALVSLIIGGASLLHLPWYPWLLIVAGLLWSIPSVFMALAFSKTRLVLLPGGMVYRNTVGDPQIALRFNTLKGLHIQENDITLVFKDEHTQKASLQVSPQALNQLRRAWLNFQMPELKQFTINETEVLKQVRQGKLFPTWKAYPNPNRLLEIVNTSAFLALLIGAPLVILIIVLALLHLLWPLWLTWLLITAGLLWGMVSIRTSLGYLHTRLVLLPRGFVYIATSGEPDFAAHYETLTELRVEDQQVTLVFKNGEQDTAWLAVSAAALRSLQDAYQSFQLHI